MGIRTVERTRGRSDMVLVGYTVEATDGEIGAIDRRTYDGRPVVVAGQDGELLKVDVSAIQRIDHRDHRVYLDVSRQELRTR